MIISHSKKFIFLRTIKTASSSVEIFLSQFCRNDDILTELFEDEEVFKKNNDLIGKRNSNIKLLSFKLKKIVLLNFFKSKKIWVHDSLENVLKSTIKNRIQNYFTFAFVRNPYDWIVSYFFWEINLNKKYKKNSIDKMSKRNLITLFNKFLDNEAEYFFNTNEKIVSHYPKKIYVYRYENLKSELKKILTKLNIKRIRIPISKIYFKRNIIKKDKKKIIDKHAKMKILKNGKFFFEKFNYPVNVPKHLKSIEINHETI